MLKASQILILVIVSLAYWALATLYIRYVPTALLGPIQAVISFALAAPVGWASILLARRLARLGQAQLLPGIGVVGASAMMLDALVLRWAPQVYGTDGAAILRGAAWLLWGYGVSFAIAVVMATRPGDQAVS
jgi:hypothetical protein